MNASKNCRFVGFMNSSEMSFTKKSSVKIFLLEKIFFFFLFIVKFRKIKWVPSFSKPYKLICSKLTSNRGFLIYVELAVLGTQTSSDFADRLTLGCNVINAAVTTNCFGGPYKPLCLRCLAKVGSSGA